jgi:hypothetical protein
LFENKPSGNPALIATFLLLKIQSILEEINSLERIAYDQFMTPFLLRRRRRRNGSKIKKYPAEEAGQRQREKYNNNKINDSLNEKGQKAIHKKLLLYVEEENPLENKNRVFSGKRMPSLKKNLLAV